MRFEWDPKKAQCNLIKLKVSFEKASTAFSDDQPVTISDPLHSESKDRFILLGYSKMNRLIVVVHTDRQDRVRNTSARKATKDYDIKKRK